MEAADLIANITQDWPAWSADRSNRSQRSVDGQFWIMITISYNLTEESGTCLLLLQLFVQKRIYSYVCICASNIVVNNEIRTQLQSKSLRFDINISSKSNGAPYYTGNRSGSTRRLKYLSGVNNQDSLTRKQKREMLNGMIVK